MGSVYRLVLAGFATALTVWTASSAPRAQTRMGLALAPGDAAPELSAAKLEAGRYTARWTRSTYTVVNFWATFCEPCRDEMPALQELSRKYPAERLTVLGVLLDSASDEAAIRFAASLGVSYTLLRGGNDVSNLWGGIGILPTTFVVNQKGRIVRRIVGSKPESTAAMTADIEALLAAQESGTKAAPVTPAPGR